MFDVLVVLENKSQTCRQEDDEEFSPLLVTLDLLQAHVSPLDHIRDNAYVRTSRGVDTLTTSPLIHVQDADKRIDAFVAPEIPIVKVAIPSFVDMVVAPRRDTDINAPVEPLIDDTTLIVQDTGGDDVKICFVAPFIN